MKLFGLFIMILGLILIWFVPITPVVAWVLIIIGLVIVIAGLVLKSRS